MGPAIELLAFKFEELIAQAVWSRCTAILRGFQCFLQLSGVDTEYDVALGAPVNACKGSSSVSA